ncbi:oxidoreductase CipA [Penicillium chermesinum]|uniref:Oxidoreductase CipA n=1 Tax=Penicillium chermesinum TaxID=63820 RepID=A0A9W9P6S5_9EURO|nr:oxidoreductase CipA [Penicillium chermesinum]KAJ5238996.1 oxidoreductase CipA [Penicillium chermesinum]
MAIKKVAIAGATGNLGPRVLTTLLDAGFEVTALSRSSPHQIDARAKVQVVDYASRDSLVAALSGQDAVVSTLNAWAVPRDIHLLLVDAAHAAGVKRFLPSEYGSDTSHPLVAKLPVFGDKIAVVDRLKEIAAKDSAFTWTSVVNGPFFDWGLQNGLLVSLKGSSSQIFNGGDVRFSTTTVAGIARAVAGVLQHPDETKNRYVYVAEAEVTQHELLRWSGRANQIKEEHISLEELEQGAYAGVNATPPDLRAFAVGLIRRAIFDSAMIENLVKQNV